MDVLMFEISQWFEGQEVVYNEPIGLITIHVVNITLTYFNSCFKVRHKKSFIFVNLTKTCIYSNNKKM